MTTFSSKTWQTDKELIACRLTQDSFPGLLRKYIKVPPLTRAFLAPQPGHKAIKKSGEEISGVREVVLVKTRTFNIEFAVKSLVTSEKYVGHCKLMLTLMAGETDFDLEQVSENLLKGRDEVRIEDIRSLLAEAIEETLKTFISKRSAEEVCLKPVITDLKESLESGLKKHLYMGGLTLSSVARMDFNCPEYTMLQNERSRIKEREEVLKSRAKLDQLELQERLARIEALKEVGVDPNVALEVELGKAHMDASRTKLLLLASGKSIVTFSPYSREPASPEEVYLLPDKMGFARSARVLRNKGKQVIAAGAQRGVYLVWLDTGESQKFFVKTKGRPRGGFNSVALAGSSVYASHSEMGLLQWNGEEEHGQPVFTDITRANKYTRGVCVHMGTVYFASGSCVYAFEPGTSKTKTVYRNGGAPVTALHVAGDSIFVGNQEGEVLHWALSYPDRPARVLLRRQGTIYSVGKMLTEQGRFILIGARDYSVTAFNPMTGTVRQYMSPDLLRWVDGAGDFVFASSYSGHRVFAWDISRASRHIYSIPVDEMAQDIYVWEEGGQ
jgi:hypothetical protein